VVPRLAAEGWERLAGLDHPAAAPVLALVGDPSRLVDALAATPQTFVQGDWKMGNLGRHPDGRTIVIDWAYPGRAPATYELAWYLGINSARLPHTKEEAIEAYRSALEGHGVATDGWFDHQLALALLGEVVLLGWEKALGGGPELDWWLDRAAKGLARL
jgi:aminoglycoside phosphotransferase (APT) family kinase protein